MPVPPCRPAGAARAPGPAPESDISDHDATEAETQRRHVVVLKIPTETADDGQLPPVPSPTIPKKRGRPPKHAAPSTTRHSQDGPGLNRLEAITQELAQVVAAEITRRPSVGSKGEDAGRPSTMTTRVSTRSGLPQNRAGIRTRYRATPDDFSDTEHSASEGSGSETTGHHMPMTMTQASGAAVAPRRRDRRPKDQGADTAEKGSQPHNPFSVRRKRKMDEDGELEDQLNTTPCKKSRPSPEVGDVDQATRKRSLREAEGLEEGTEGTTGVKKRRLRSRKEPVDDTRSRIVPARRAAVAGRDSMRQHAEAYISAADGESSEDEVERFVAAARPGAAEVRSRASTNAYTATTHETVDSLPIRKRRGRPPRNRPVEGQSVSLRLSMPQPSRGVRQTPGTGEPDVAVRSEPPPGSSTEPSNESQPVPAAMKRAIRPTEKAVGAGGVTVRRTSTPNVLPGESERERPTPDFPDPMLAPGPGRVGQSPKATAGESRRHSLQQPDGIASALNTQEPHRPEGARTSSAIDPFDTETASAHEAPLGRRSPGESVAEASSVAEPEPAGISAGLISPTSHVHPADPDPAVTGKSGRRRKDAATLTGTTPQQPATVPTGVPASSLIQPKVPAPATDPPVKRRGRPPRNPDHVTTSVATGSPQMQSTLVDATAARAGLSLASDAIVPKRRGRPPRNSGVATLSSVGHGSPPAMTGSLSRSSLPVTPDSSVPKRCGRPPRTDPTALLASTMPGKSKPEDTTSYGIKLRDHGEEAVTGLEGASKVPAKSEKRAAAMRAWWGRRKAAEAAATAETAAPPDHVTGQEEAKSAEKETEGQSGSSSRRRSKTKSESENEKQSQKPIRWKLYFGSERKAKLEAEAALLNEPGDTSEADEQGQISNKPQSESKSQQGGGEEEEEERSSVPDTALVQEAKRKSDSELEEWVDERSERDALCQGEDHHSGEPRKESKNKQAEELGSPMKVMPENEPEEGLGERGSDMRLNGELEGDSGNASNFQTDDELGRETFDESNRDVESRREEQPDNELEKARENRKLEPYTYSQSPGPSAINERSEEHAPAAVASATGEEAPLDVSSQAVVVIKATAEVPQVEGDKGSDEKQEELDRRIDGIMAEFGQEDVIMHFARRLSSR